MVNFNAINVPDAMDFFTIELDENGQKQIKLIGFTYLGDNWKVIDVRGICLPISEFVEGMKESEDYVNELYTESREYEEDVTDEQCVNAINYFFDGEPADYYLHFEDVTIDTPVGNYIDINTPSINVGDKVLWADKRTPIGKESVYKVLEVGDGLVKISYGKPTDMDYFEVEVPWFEVIKIERD